MAQLVKKLSAIWETWVRSLGWDDPLEKRTATHLFWPGEFHGLYSLWGHKESDMTQRLSLSLSKPKKKKKFCQQTAFGLKRHLSPSLHLWTYPIYFKFTTLHNHVSQFLNWPTHSLFPPLSTHIHTNTEVILFFWTTVTNNVWYYNITLSTKSINFPKFTFVVLYILFA